ncbi:MAG: TetR family transcriptional regulator [Actinomycetota bacterium]|nr:TetR family transcriptional regulator [Actinomycetota bacterium]
MQGYHETTTEQIAEAALVSTSTLFRYFPSKEDLMLTDNYDPLIIEACRTQPAQLGPVEAIRHGLRAVFATMDDQDLADMKERAELALIVPALRAAMLDQFAQVIRQLTDVVATLAGAVLGVAISTAFYWVEHPDTDLVALIDEALADLESGLPL